MLVAVVKFRVLFEFSADSGLRTVHESRNILIPAFERNICLVFNGRVCFTKSLRSC